MQGMTWKRWLWVAVVLIVCAYHMLVGALIGIATAFYWLLVDRQKPPFPLPQPTPMRVVRLSETKEIQAAFQNEMFALFRETGTPALAEITNPGDILDGKTVGEMFVNMHDNLVVLGFKAEHESVLRSLCYLLEQCERLEATPENLAVMVRLFHPGKPTTPEVAEAYKEVVERMAGCIEPNVAGA